MHRLLPPFDLSALAVSALAASGVQAFEPTGRDIAYDVGGETFEGYLATPEGQQYGSDTLPLLIAHGGADSAVPLEEVVTLAQELEAADVTYEIEIYSGAPHAFTVFTEDRYQQRADEKSWAAFQELLDNVLAAGDDTGEDRSG